MNRVGMGLAIGAGYVLGRTKKMKLAFAVGSLVAGKKMNLTPKGVADLVSGQLKNNPQFKEIGDQLREDLRGVGKAASGAMVERQVDALADRLHGRTAQVRDQLAGVVPDVGSEDSADSEDSEDDERAEDSQGSDDTDDYEGAEDEESQEEPEAAEADEDDEDEEADEDSEPPRKQAKKAPARKAPAKKTASARKAPARKAPAKKAAGKTTSAAKKTAGKKTAAARGAGGGARNRHQKGGGE
ncbi:DNA primase [Streptomyces cellulosae]|uniref:DNA primase n=1 Tax=Streptomyces cellulosae TaxID=1968 RepID=A0ABW7XVH9_STRCE